MKFFLNHVSSKILFNFRIMAVIKLFPLSFPVVNMKLSIALTSVGNEWLPDWECNEKIPERNGT